MGLEAMSIVADIADRSMLAFGVILLVSQLLMHEAGFWIGRRHSARDVQVEGVGTVVGGMLGLLAFVLALTLSFANTRFNERRDGTLAEANAIGTAWLRAGAIDHPRGPEIARLLEQYTEVRMDFVRAGRHAATLDEIDRRTGSLQSTIWGHVAAISRERQDPVVVSLMTSLNEVFDMSTAERFAYDLRLPPQIFWLLIGMTLLSMAALGYQVGLKGGSVRMLVVLLVAMWTIVIIEIIDLAAARIGSVRTGTAVYEWTRKGFEGGVVIPPPGGR